MGELIRPNVPQWQTNESSDYCEACDYDMPSPEQVALWKWQERERERLSKTVRAFVATQKADRSVLLSELEQHAELLKSKSCYRNHLRSIRNLQSTLATEVAHHFRHPLHNNQGTPETWQLPSTEDMAKQYGLRLTERIEHISKGIQDSVRSAREQERLKAFIHEQEQLHGPLLTIKDIRKIFNLTTTGVKAVLKRSGIKTITFHYFGTTNVNFWVKGDIEALTSRTIQQRASP